MLSLKSTPSVSGALRLIGSAGQGPGTKEKGGLLGFGPGVDTPIEKRLEGYKIIEIESEALARG